MTFDKIKKNVSQQVLVVGPDYRNPKGGIAAVLNVYSSIFERFIFLSTCPQNSKSLLIKELYALFSIVKLFLFLLVNKNIKILHVHSSSRGSFRRKRIVIRIGKLFGKKIIFHSHSGHFKEFRNEHLIMVDNTLKRCDIIVALSNEWKDYFNGIGFHNVEVINNVINSPVYNEIKWDNKLHCLFLGLIGDNKGIFDLLSVLEEHHSVLKGHFMLHIGGNGEIIKLNKFIEDHQLSDIISFEGWVDKDKKIELYNKTSAFILPSYHEGVPITLLEAMSYKKAVITTPVGGIPSIVKNGYNGLLVNPGNKKEIWNAIDYIMKNPNECEKFGENGYNISKNYLPETISKQLIKLYQSLC